VEGKIGSQVRESTTGYLSILYSRLLLPAPQSSTPAFNQQTNLAHNYINAHNVSVSHLLY
jgi:hypothetical protein